MTEKMDNYKLSLSGLFMSLLLSGCLATAPHSLRMRSYSATLGLPLWPAAYTTTTETESTKQDGAVLMSIESHPLPNPAPFPDYKVIRFTPGSNLCRDTFRLPDLSRVNIVAGAGTMIFSPDGLAIDEVEITNIDWRLFVANVSTSDTSVAKILPDSAVLPVEDYYTSPFYAYYPVVGISYEQAKRFCEWRTKAWNKALKDSNLSGLLYEYRLPTEAEWEEAAEGRNGLPYGTTCTQLSVRVAEGAAAYLQKRANTSAPVSQIKIDIAVYNKQHPIRSWINYLQAEPYFLRLATPGYVYQGPPNNFGLYQMLGNVAEMVQERGVTKGGSYRDDLADCRIKARGSFTGPSPTVGFRAVCVMHRAAPAVK